MNRRIGTLLLILIIGITSCSSSFIVRTKKKTINLNSLSKNSIKVGLDNGIVQIKFDRNDLIELFETDLNEWFDPRIKSYVDDLKSLELDTIYKKDKTVSTLPLAEYELKFHTLILSGKAEFRNIETEKKLNRIKYKFTKDKLGGQNAYFYNENGLEIYEIVLAYGE